MSENSRLSTRNGSRNKKLQKCHLALLAHLQVSALSLKSEDDPRVTLSPCIPSEDSTFCRRNVSSVSRGPACCASGLRHGSSSPLSPRIKVHTLAALYCPSWVEVRANRDSDLEGVVRSQNPTAGKGTFSVLLIFSQVYLHRCHLKPG
jgi:hypothetical protein